jgi:hypothetical protein
VISDSADPATAASTTSTPRTTTSRLAKHSTATKASSGLAPTRPEENAALGSTMRMPAATTNTPPTATSHPGASSSRIQAANTARTGTKPSTTAVRVPPNVSIDRYIARCDSPGANRPDTTYGRAVDTVIPANAPVATAIVVTTRAAVETEMTAAWVEPTPVLAYAHRNATNTAPNDAAATSPRITACM